MRICFLTHNLRQDNGAGVFSSRLIEGMREAFGAEVVALTTQTSGLPFERPILYPGRLKLLRQLLTIRQICRSADIVHALDVYPYGVIARIALWGTRKTLIITAVGTGALAQFGNPWYARLLRWTYRGANSVTAISHFTAREIQRRVPGLVVRVIPHGVDFDHYARARTFRSKRQSSRYYPYILSVGALRWRKGYHASIEAFAKVTREIPNLIYIIVGRFHAVDYRERIEQVIKKHSLQDRIVILEKVPEGQEAMQELYGGAELFCLAAQNYDNRDYEGFGLVFLEAAASGLPVVGTNQSGIEDAVHDGENGFLIAPKDVNGFAEALLKLLQDKALATRMSESSLSIAKHSTWERAIAGYAEFYRKIGVSRNRAALAHK